MPVSRFVAVNGLRLHYLDHGTAGQPALVCLHGLTGNARHFDALAPHLVSRYHVHALDVRGRGESQWGTADGYTTENYVDDLAGFLDALQIGRVTLVGSSMGGIISIFFAGSRPERVERMVLNDIGPEIDPSGLGRILDGLAATPLEFDSLEAVVSFYRATYPPMRRFSEETLYEFARYAVKPGRGGKLAWKMDPQIRRLPRDPARAQPRDMWTPFRRIAAPILVVRGAESDLLAPRTVAAMKAAAPNVKSVEVPGAGHAPTLVEPEALAALKEFLEL